MAVQRDDDGAYDFAEPAPPKPRLPPVEAKRKPAPPPKEVERQEPLAKPVARVDANQGAAKEEPAEMATHTCLHCGYSYRGKRKARCPECASSAQGDTELMQFADAGWVRSAALGLLLVGLGIAAHVAGCVFNRLDEGEPKGVAHVIGGVLVVLGVFMATKREPMRKAGVVPAQSAITVWARVLAVVALLVWLAAGALALSIWRPQEADIKSMMHLKKMLTLAVLLPQGVMCVLLTVQCVRLAVRIPSDSLAWHANTSGWLSGGVCGFLIFAVGLEFDRGDFMLFFMVSYPFIVIMLIIMVWAMITLVRFYFEMRGSAAAGENIEQSRQQRALEKQTKQSRRDDSAGSPLGL